MRDNLGPSKLIWYHTNKQRAFEFMADEVVLAIDQETHQVRIDPLFVKLVLDKEPKEENMIVAFNGTTAMALDCSFKNPDYGNQIAARFIKRLKKSWLPQQMLLVPDYGLATTAQSMLFKRALPFLVTNKQFVFHLLPNEQGERVRHGV